MKKTAHQKKSSSIAQNVWSDVQAIRSQSPLVHNITNYVVMNNTANALLALGASPIMAHANEEMDEMVKICSALVVNIGTLSKPWITAMTRAMRLAKQIKHPIVLDPVGSGASRLRTDTATALLKLRPTVLRGNASEILSLASVQATTKGVDSADSSHSAINAAKSISKKYGCVVSISGETDYIIHGDRMAQVRNGHPMMTKVTGLGCTASSLTGAFCAVNSDSFLAATHAMVVMGIVGELAHKKSKGPGSLQMNFIDGLFNLSQHDIATHIKVDY